MHTKPHKKKQNHSIQEAIRHQYSKYPYPEPIQDLNIAIPIDYIPLASPERHFYQCWPFKKKDLGLDILIAGCGSLQAPLTARRIPAAKITAIDISPTALRHSRFLCKKHGIKNVEHIQMPLEEVPSLGRDFDFVVSTGVLHHLEKTETGLTALRKITRKEGSLLVALYGRYGRVGVEILQHFYRAINLTPSKKNLETLRQTLRLLDKKHHPFFSNMDWYGADLYNPSGLVDLLLQKKERLFSVPELGALVEQCGLVVQEFVFRSRYEPSCSALAETPIMSGLGKRPQQDQYAAVELFRATLHMHTVILCRKDRPLKTRQIELSDTAWKSYIPLPNKALCFEKRNCPAMAHTVGFLPGNRYFNIRSPLSGEEWRLLRLVDGTRSFGEILTRSGHPKNEKRIREFFQKMREHEFLFLRGNPDNQEG